MSDVSTSENPDPKASDVEALERERYELLQRLEDWLETPMLVLAFVWLALLIVELIWGESLWFEIIGTTIWVIFLLDFAVELVLAPHRVAYLKRNWVTAISLLIPALRIFRIFRVFRLLRLARPIRGPHGRSLADPQRDLTAAFAWERHCRFCLRLSHKSELSARRKSPSSQTRSKGFRDAVEANPSRRNGVADRRRDLCDSLASQR